MAEHIELIVHESGLLIDALRERHRELERLIRKNDRRQRVLLTEQVCEHLTTTRRR